jgi:hypothetical protein
MKNRQTVLQFPKPPQSPQQPQSSTITFQIGRERYAIHYEIEELPTAPLLMPVVARPPVRRARFAVVPPRPKRNESLGGRIPYADGD